MPYGFLSTIFELSYRGEKQIEEDALRYLEIFKLVTRGMNWPKTCLTANRVPEIARAMTQPTLILDEPAAGMNPQETRDIGE